MDHLYSFSTHVVSPSEVHTPGNSRCCHYSEDLVTRRYPCPCFAYGIGSCNKKCFPTVACTLQSGMCAGSYATLALEPLSHVRFLRRTILLVNPCVAVALPRALFLMSSSCDSSRTLPHLWCRFTIFRRSSSSARSKVGWHFSSVNSLRLLGPDIYRLLSLLLRPWDIEAYVVH